MNNRWSLVVVLLLLTIPAGLVRAQDGSEPRDPGRVIEVAPHTSLVWNTQKPVTRVAVADPKLADIELLTTTQLLIVAQEKAGVTSLILWHGDRETEVYRIRVRLPDSLWGEIQSAIDRLVPGAHVKVERLGEDGVALDGTVENQKDLDRILEVTKKFAPTFTNMVTLRGSQQVQLEVKVAEVSRSGIKQMGLGFLLDKDYKIGLSPSGTMAGTMSGTSAAEAGIRQTTSSLDSTASLSSPFGSAFQVLIHLVGNDTLLLLNLLKSQGLSRLLASPTLVTMNGQRAEFLVGGEFPYPWTATDNGTTSTSIQFKQFGIILGFTPYIVDKETVTLVVEPEVSALDYSVLTVSGGTTVPGISTRRAQSTIQLKDGQVFAMAGLLREETTSSVSKIPFLGDIPVLGTFFTSKSYEDRETELVIIVCPRIVTAMSAAHAPPLPGGPVRTRLGDLEFFVNNRAVAERAASSGDAPPRTPRFKGEIGFSP